MEAGKAELTIPYKICVLTYLLTHSLTARHNILPNTTLQKPLSRSSKQTFLTCQTS